MSLVGSSSRTTLRALSANWLTSPAYWTVVALSKVDLIGMPVELIEISKSNCRSSMETLNLPSLLITTIPTTPLWD